MKFIKVGRLGRCHTHFSEGTTHKFEIYLYLQFFPLISNFSDCFLEPPDPYWLLASLGIGQAGNIGKDVTSRVPRKFKLANLYTVLTPKGRSPVFGPFLKFREAIVYVIFVQKISNFGWTCGLVLASRCTFSYKILIFGLGVMPPKQNPCTLRVGLFFINSLQIS
jgi:hypothetical protein